MIERENDHDEITGKVLFVDDEISILNSLQRRFFMADFEVLTANNANDGLKIIEKENIDILVTDYRLPKMDGIELLKIVKKKYPTVSRVILSGFVERAAVISSLTKGLTTTYIAKPWEDVVLEERINHILQTQVTTINRRKDPTHGERMNHVPLTCQPPIIGNEHPTCGERMNHIPLMCQQMPVRISHWGIHKRRRAPHPTHMP